MARACTLSSAIACGLAEGLALPEAVSRAKDYLTGALSSGLTWGEAPVPWTTCGATAADSARTARR